MDFLSKIEIEHKIINELNNNIPDKLKELLNQNEKVVLTNLNYLKEIGIENYVEVFSKYYDMFLLDVSTFKQIFDKYEPSDLIEKVKKNIDIVEYL